MRLFRIGWPVVLLTACGGGADRASVVVPEGVRSASASAGSDLSADGIDNFTGPMARVVLSLTGDTFLGGPVARGGDAGSMVMGTLSTRALLGRALAPARREQAQVVTTEQLQCEFGGSINVAVNDGDESGSLSAGDAVSVAASNCVVESGRPPVSGTFAISFNAVELDRTQAVVAFDVSGNYSQFRLGNVAQLNGEFRLWVKPQSETIDRVRMSYDNVTSTLLGETLVYNVDVDGNAGQTVGSYSISGSVGINGETYAAVQQAAFTVPAGRSPSDGAFALLDAAGDSLLLHAKPMDRLDFEFTASGESAPSALRTDQTWDSFERE